MSNDTLDILQKALKEYGHHSEQYYDAFVVHWNSRIPTLTDAQIKDIMEDAKPHTQATKGLETMAFLYDRLMTICVERGI